MRAVTGRPIKLIGTGEKTDALEAFHPDRIAGRILGMGDIVSLVEKAAESVDRNAAEKMAAKFQKGQFDFNDLLSQMQQMSKMGGLGAMMKMLPGMGSMMNKAQEAGLDDSFIKRQEAIIFSMTKSERANPDLLNASRKKRIAAGSGTSVQDINRIVKQLRDMQTMMKRLRKMGPGKMMGMMKGLMGGGGAGLGAELDDMSDLAETLDPKLLQDMGSLGQNPFAPGGTLFKGKL
jgi:signal recognition particle subunit SRP54